MWYTYVYNLTYHPNLLLQASYINYAEKSGSLLICETKALVS